MNVGLTGATGFLGRAFLAEAARRAWRVVAYSRHPGVEVEGADETRSLADRESINLDSLDALVHLAGEPIVAFWSEERKRRIVESRVDLTEDLVSALASRPPGERPSVFVSASAVGYYGDRGDEWLDEESDPGFGFLSKLCFDWESEAMKASDLGIREVRVRIGLVLGREGFLQKLRPLFRLGLGGRLGRGGQWMSWIHVDDVAAILAEAVANPHLRGPVNAAAPAPVRNREFAALYARVLGRRALAPVPGFVLKRLPGGMGRLFLDGQRVEPAAMVSLGFAWRHPDLEAALRAVEAERREAPSSPSGP